MSLPPQFLGYSQPFSSQIKFVVLFGDGHVLFVHYNSVLILYHLAKGVIFTSKLQISYQHIQKSDEFHAALISLQDHKVDFFNILTKRLDRTIDLIGEGDRLRSINKLICSRDRIILLETQAKSAQLLLFGQKRFSFKVRPQAIYFLQSEQGEEDFLYFGSSIPKHNRIQIQKLRITNDSIVFIKILNFAMEQPCTLHRVFKDRPFLSCWGKNPSLWSQDIIYYGRVFQVFVADSLKVIFTVLNQTKNNIFQLILYDFKLGKMLVCQDVPRLHRLYCCQTYSLTCPNYQVPAKLRQSSIGKAYSAWVSGLQGYKGQRITYLKRKQVSRRLLIRMILS